MSVFFHVTGAIADPAQLPPLIEAEKRVSQELQDGGFTLFAFRRADHPGVLMAVEAASRAEAEATLATLPFVSAGAMTVELVEVLPA